MSKQTISTITDQVMDGMAEWQNRPLDRVYPVLFVDAINVKIRDGKVANRPIYMVMAVTVDGTRDILGIWAGDGGEGAKYWLHVFTELKNRGLGRRAHAGLRRAEGSSRGRGDRLASHDCPDVCGSPAAELIPLRRPSGLGQGRQGPQAVYTAPSEDAATERFLEFQDSWGRKYPAIVKLWSDAWAEFVPFLSFDVEIRKVICSTNAIESVNARIRKAVRTRGHFPNEAAALKCTYMALMSLDPTGKGRKRWTMRWKAP